MAFSLPAGTEKEVAAECRDRARQIAAHAATQTDKRMQRWYLDIASTYQRMADHLEAKFGVPQAVKASDTQDAAPQEIAAVVAPTPPPDPEPKS